uniref:Uncharacterized protein n=1 Tax=Anguilla anguilla TaxID=7936 RepID=A0A0E9UCZ3_ANGAN
MSTGRDSSNSSSSSSSSGFFCIAPGALVSCWMHL